MIVAGHPLAAMAGMRVLEAGGNAVDAGVAAGFALNVVQPDMANLGGVAPIMIRLADGEITSFAGVGRWPRGLTRDRLAALGGGRIPAGPARWVVPAAVASWLTALARHGSWRVADVLSGAIALAAEGFPANPFLRHNLAHLFDQGAASEAEAAFFPEGRVPEIGEIVRQPALADTLRRLAAAERARGGTRADGIGAARDAFYTGEIPARIERFAREVGGFVTADDMADFAVAELAPVAARFRGHVVHCCGPWSQGPALAQMLMIAEGMALERLAPVERAHCLIEASKRALRDRNRYYGDPDVADVPLARLLSEEHAAGHRSEIEAARAPSRAAEKMIGDAGPDTTYVCVVDAAGNAFSANPSDSTILVSPMVPGLGFGISDRGLQASLDPADPNVMAPGKRPRLTPNPVIVTGDHRVMPCGTPGGDIQTQAMLQFLVNHLALGMDLQAAVEAPRWASFDVPATEDPHPSRSNLVRLERRGDPALFEGLVRAGHDVEAWAPLSALAGAVCAISRDPVRLAGGADPRRMSYGIGW